MEDKLLDILALWKHLKADITTPPPTHPLNLTHILLEVPGCLKYITLHFYVIVHWHCSFIRFSFM